MDHDNHDTPRDPVDYILLGVFSLMGIGLLTLIGTAVYGFYLLYVFITQ